MGSDTCLSPNQLGINMQLFTSVPVAAASTFRPVSAEEQGGVKPKPRASSRASKPPSLVVIHPSGAPRPTVILQAPGSSSAALFQLPSYLPLLFQLKLMSLLHLQLLVLIIFCSALARSASAYGCDPLADWLCGPPAPLSPLPLWLPVSLYNGPIVVALLVDGPLREIAVWSWSSFGSQCHGPPGCGPIGGCGPAPYPAGDWLPLTCSQHVQPPSHPTPAPVIANHVDPSLRWSWMWTSCPLVRLPHCHPHFHFTVPPAPLIKSLLLSLILSLTPFTPFLTLPLTTTDSHRLN